MWTDNYINAMIKGGSNISVYDIEWLWKSLSFPFVGGEVLPATFSPPRLIVFPSLLCLLLPVFLLSCLPHISPQSSHLSLGLPRLLLPCSHNSVALFGSLSSAILSTCPAHCNLLPNSLSVKLLCTPVSSLNSTIVRLSALVTLAIFRTQLFSHICSLCCRSSVSAKVSVPYRHAGVTHALVTLPFSLLEIHIDCNILYSKLSKVK